MNVYWNGLSGSEVDMTACRLRTPTASYWIAKRFGTYVLAQTYVLDPDQTTHSWQYWWSPSDPTSFPYGASVEPD